MKLIKYFFLISIMTGCAVTGKNVVAPIDQAILVAKNDSLLSVLLPLKNNASLQFTEIDGKNIQNWWHPVDKLTVEPGKHEVKLSCQLLVGYPSSALYPSDKWGESVHSLDVKAGYKYIFRVIPISKNKCGTTFEEVI